MGRLVLRAARSTMTGSALDALPEEYSRRSLALLAPDAYRSERAVRVWESQGTARQEIHKEAMFDTSRKEEAASAITIPRSQPALDSDRQISLECSGADTLAPRRKELSMGVGRRSRQVGAALMCMLAALILVQGVATGASGDAVCSDDFDDPTSGWETVDSMAGSTLYANGGRFEIRMADHDNVFWTWSPCQSIPDSFSFEATCYSHARVTVYAGVSGVGADPDPELPYVYGVGWGLHDVGWGVAWGVDDENVIVFLITSSGWTTVLSMRNGEWQFPLIDWKMSSAIDTGDRVPNTLQVSVDGDWVTVGINDHRVGRFKTGARVDVGFGLLEGAPETAPGPVSLADGSGWKVGLAVSSVNQSRGQPRAIVEVQFDGFAVYAEP